MGPLKKSGSPNVTCCAPDGHLLSNILAHYLAPDHAEMPLIDRRHGTVPAKMLAAAAGLSVSDELDIAVLPQLGVAREIRQSCPVRDNESLPGERNRRRRVAICEVDQGGLEFAADHFETKLSQ